MKVIKHKKFLNPPEIIAEAGIKRGDSVADFGCAAGYFSLPAAAAVGDDGHVVAIDILPQALETVESKARLAGYHIVETRCANVEKAGGSGLDDESMDWVILKNVLFMSDDDTAMLREAFRVMRNGGHALIVEWNDTYYGIGPKESDRIVYDVMRESLERVGFIFERDISVGDYHYGIIAKK